MNPKPTSRAIGLALFAAALAGGCTAHQHSVGLGATGSGVIAARQYYFLFGFFQVNEVDAQRMAGNLTSYSIETKYGLVDMLLAPLLLPLTATSRTVVVRT
ncbi:MAG: hypothetical protein JNK78_06735 [Planctomycetes bacterium]|nr:hypothetical protein [Planctomycetota bacterium]